MKNFFRAATSWLNKSKTEEAEEKSTPAETQKAPIAKPALKTAAPVAAPVKSQSASSAPKPAPRRVEEEAPARPAPMNLSSLNAGPEVKLFTRASKVYATCPHCEASWNLRERIAHPSFRRDESKGLTCPACDKGVSLPATLDLRKLS
jgi:hypothetical protein